MKNNYERLSDYIKKALDKDDIKQHDTRTYVNVKLKTKKKKRKTVEQNILVVQDGKLKGKNVLAKTMYRCNMDNCTGLVMVISYRDYGDDFIKFYAKKCSKCGKQHKIKDALKLKLVIKPKATPQEGIDFSKINRINEILMLKEKYHVNMVHKQCYCIDRRIHIFPLTGRYVIIKTKEEGKYPLGSLAKFIESRFHLLPVNSKNDLFNKIEKTVSAMLSESNHKCANDNTVYMIEFVEFLISKYQTNEIK